MLRQKIGQETENKETRLELHKLKWEIFTIVLNKPIKGRGHFQGTQYHQSLLGNYHRMIGQLIQNNPARENTN